MFYLNILVPPPYNPKTGESLGPKRPDNYGRPIIKKDDDKEEDHSLTASEQLGDTNNPFDKVMIRTTIPPPDKDLITAVLKGSRRSQLSREEVLALAKRILVEKKKSSS